MFKLEFNLELIKSVFSYIKINKISFLLHSDVLFKKKIEEDTFDYIQ